MSRKQVPLSKDEIKVVLELMSERHRLHLAPGERFELAGHMNHGEVWVRMRLTNPEETEVVEIESRVDLVSNDLDNPLAGKELLLDLLDEGFQDFFGEDRMWRPPLEWAPLDYKGHQVELRGSVRNLKLERMADELLAQAGDDLDGGL